MTSVRDTVHKMITEAAFVQASEEPILDKRRGVPREDGWLFDFRRVLLKEDSLRAVCSLFWDEFSDHAPVQIGCIETAGIPLATGIVMSGKDHDQKNVNSFFIRKSRKKDGLMRMVEGEVMEGQKIVLVDDIMNSGKSFIRQIEVLEELGYTVDTVWSVLRFRDEDFYTYFHDKGITVKSLFTLNDFKESLGTTNRTLPEPHKMNMPFKVLWKFASENPNYAYVVPKSDPVLDEKCVYFGSDAGIFWALNQEDGATAWSYKVGFHARGKSIFSSPALYKDMVIFGAYDGNVYALDKETGKKRWIFWEADHVGSSPAVADDLETVFVGLEFGLIRKRGGIAALDAKTGKKIWDYSMAAYTHSSPYYIKETKQVVIGGNEGIVYLFDAKTGKLQWEFKTGEATQEEVDAGFSEFDIKESFTYDAKRDYIVFGNREGHLFALEQKTGKEVWRFKAEFAFHATPLVYKDTVIASSLDKYLYSIDIKTGEEKWRWNAGARIFASPVLIEGSVYIGANTGRMTEIDPETGKELSFITVPERITNKVAYNPNTKRYFLPTFANEIYCLEKKDDA